MKCELINAGNRSVEINVDMTGTLRGHFQVTANGFGSDYI